MINSSILNCLNGKIKIQISLLLPGSAIHISKSEISLHTRHLVSYSTKFSFLFIAKRLAKRLITDVKRRRQLSRQVAPATGTADALTPADASHWRRLTPGTDAGVSSSASRNATNNVAVGCCRRKILRISNVRNHVNNKKIGTYISHGHIGTSVELQVFLCVGKEEKIFYLFILC